MERDRKRGGGDRVDFERGHRFEELSVADDLEIKRLRRQEEKRELAAQICQALTVHAEIEEEIFYPAFIEATEEEDIHHEAVVEHDGAKKLIKEIEASGPDDDYFDARVSVLSEMIKHHVKEEEQRDGMFAKAKQSDMDLEALGEQLKARKDELMAQAGQPKGRSRRGMTEALAAAR